MSEPTSSPTQGEPAAGRGSGPHVVPLAVLVAVFAALIALTYLTVAATHYDLGDWNLAIAMGIASVKALLVALYFMHLRYDHPLFALIFAAGLVFVFLFISLTLLDTLEYQSDTDPWADTLTRSGEPQTPMPLRSGSRTLNTNPKRKRGELSAG